MRSRISLKTIFVRSHGKSKTMNVLHIYCTRHGNIYTINFSITLFAKHVVKILWIPVILAGTNGSTLAKKFALVFC